MDREVGMRVNGTRAKVVQRVKDRSKMKEQINTGRKDQRGSQI